MDCSGAEPTRCGRIFREKASGADVGSARTPQTSRSTPQGDVLVVWNLHRLSRFLGDVLTIMERLGEAGAGLRSLTAVSIRPRPQAE
jgi:DNA invertase Pin-like site-specific DNA recombinase